MTSMEDLISSITGGMHVSQEGYEIKALQEYLAQNLALPTACYPTSSHFQPGAPSRAPSATRKPASLPTSHNESASGQPMPSPMIHTYGGSATDGESSYTTSPAAYQRPGGIRRSSSYGFMPVTPQQHAYAFEHDAFAPLVQQQIPPADPWARFRQATEQANAWAGPSNAAAGPSYQSQATGGMQRTPPSHGQQLGGQDDAGADQYDNDDEDMEMSEAEACLGVGGEVDHRQADEDEAFRLREHDRRLSYTPQEQHGQFGWGHMPALEAAQRPVSEPGFSWDRGRRHT